ncbi:MAG: hypothetical protein JWO33_1215, partial [Caulobacteraceae bacterium]|nr:hypothetical protein [Caulobacteraceae bacterium]
MIQSLPTTIRRAQPWLNRGLAL